MTAFQSDISTSNTPVAGRVVVRPSRTTVIPFVGFCSFVLFSQLYENCLLFDNVTIFNFNLYESIAHLLVLLLLVVAGLMRHWIPSPTLVQSFGLLGALGMTAQLLAPSTLVVSFGAVASGVSLAGLAVAWGTHLSQHNNQSILPFVLGAFLLSMAICYACFCLPNLTTQICAIGAPLISGIVYTKSRLLTDDAEEGSVQKKRMIKRDALQSPAVQTRVSWPLVATLCACCFLGYTFAGMTLNPYCFQSVTVSHYLYLFALAALFALFAWSLITRQPKTNLLLVAPLILLLVGLLLFSTGILGSIIMPLGLILSARTCCLALCWTTLIRLAEQRQIPSVAVFGLGLAVCDGTLGRSIGQMASINMGLSFPDIALAASACIVALALFYALATAFHLDLSASALHGPQSGAGANSGAGVRASSNSGAGANMRSDARVVEPVPNTSEVMPTMEQLVAETQRLREKRLQSFNLTQQEDRVARLVLQNKTYQEIAEECTISLRTVKFHTKNIYRKANVEGRSEFQFLMRIDN